MALGLFSIEWNNTLSSYNVKRPQTDMEIILDTVWEDLCEPVCYLGTLQITSVTPSSSQVGVYFGAQVPCPRGGTCSVG